VGRIATRTAVAASLPPDRRVGNARRRWGRRPRRQGDSPRYLGIDRTPGRDRRAAAPLLHRRGRRPPGRRGLVSRRTAIATPPSHTVAPG